MAASKGSASILLVGLLLAVALAGTTALPSLQIWVSNAGSDATGDGTEANPFQTTTKAFQVHPNNVLLNLVSGHYNLSVPSSATSIAVVGQPTASLDWFFWQQVGGTEPMTIYAENLDVGTFNASIFPLFQLSGQLQNATLNNVRILASAPSATEPVASFQTGVLANSHLELDNVVISNNGTATVDVQISGFNSVTTRSVNLLGKLGTVSVKNVHSVVWFGGSMAFGASPAPNTGNVIFVKSAQVSLSRLMGIGVRLGLHNNMMTSVSDSSFIFSVLQVGNYPTEACLNGFASVSLTSNAFESSVLEYDNTKSTHGACVAEGYTTSFKANTFQIAFETKSPVPIDFVGNFWGASTGPSICSNPGGVGATVSFNMDYSAWCENRDCTVFNGYPMLLKAVVQGPCQRPTAGAIVAFIIIFFVLVAISVVMIIIYCMYCTPIRTDSESIHVHYARMTSVMATLAAASLVVLALSGIIGSASCPTRVYATHCPFTLTDRAVAGNGLLFGCLMLMVSAGTLALLKFNFQEQRPILYTAVGYQVLSLGIGGVILVLSLMNLSSALRGPYMHLLAVPAAGYAVFCVLQLFHMEKLRHHCRHTHIALELSDYKHERARLVQGSSSSISDPSLVPADSDEYEAGASTHIASSSDALSESESGESSLIHQIPAVKGPEIDEYSFTTVQPIQVFYSDYQSVTKRWLIGENSIFAILLAFAIWYTIASYRTAGALMITVIILEYLRIILAIHITKSRGPLFGFKLLMGFTSVTKLALLAISIFLYVQVFSLSSHNSAYFTASLLAPTFFFGIVTTIRVWKMFEAVHDKYNRL